MLLPLLLALQPALQPAQSLDVFGDWRIPPDEPDGPSRGIVRIAPDADPDNDIQDGTPVGTILRVGEVYRGTPEADAFIGTRIVWRFERDEDRWQGGRILDPEAGRTYRANMRRVGDTLEVEGCLAFICREQVWERVNEAGTGRE